MIPVTFGRDERNQTMKVAVEFKGVTFCLTPGHYVVDYDAANECDMFVSGPFQSESDAQNYANEGARGHVLTAG